jgi:hypothetical protein
MKRFNPHGLEGAENIYFQAFELVNMQITLSYQGSNRKVLF